MYLGLAHTGRPWGESLRAISLRILGADTNR